MTLNDAKVEGSVTDEGELRLGLHAVALVKDKLEFLLVDGSRRQQCGFHTPAEPLMHGTFDVAEMLDALLLWMGSAFSGTIT